MEESLKKSKSRATEEVMQLNFSKKKKLYCVLGNDYRSEGELPANALSPVASETSGCSKYDESSEVRRRRLRSSDLADIDLWYECSGTTIPAFISDILSEEATPLNELCGDSQQSMLMDSSSASTEKSISPPPPAASPARKISDCVAKTPSAAELEEFFAEAEENVRKRFAEKYNYDIVKDAPISEGRYQWVRIRTLI